MIAAFIELFTIPLFGWLADRHGRRIMFVLACLFSILFAFPLFWLFDTADLTIIAITVAIALSLGQGVMFAIGAAWMSELFDARLRYSGASLGFQVGAALSGAASRRSLPQPCWAWSGATWPISVYS